MLKQELLEILVCPKCHSKLEHQTEPEEALICRKCNLLFPVREDIPIMLIDEAIHLENKKN